MRKSRFTEEQIIRVLKETEAGRRLADVRREHGISQGTLYRWKSKYSGLEVSDAKRLHELEDENRRLKSLVADQSLDIQALKAALGKEVVKPQGRRRLVSFFQEAFGLSRRRACGLAQISRSVVEYRSRRTDDQSLRERILAWACERSRYGYRRIHLLLRREGWAVNRKRVYRIDREEALSVRRRKRKQVAASPRQAIVVPERANERWSMDIMADTLADGRTFRTLNLVDDFTREALAIEVGRSIPGQRVVRVLERITKARGLPRRSSSTTVRSSRAGFSTSGPTAAASSCASPSRASPCRTPSWRASTGSSATSA